MKELNLVIYIIGAVLHAGTYGAKSGHPGWFDVLMGLIWFVHLPMQIVWSLLLTIQIWYHKVQAECSIEPKEES